MHRRLAELVADEERRALHLALATDTPNKELRRPDREGGRPRRGARSDPTRRRPGHALLAPHAARRAGVRPPAGRGHALPRRRRAAAAHRPAGSRGAESLPAGGSRVLGYHLLASGGVVHGNDEITALHEKALEEAGDIQPCRRDSPSWPRTSRVIEVRDVAASDERAAEAVADSVHGDPYDRDLRSTRDRGPRRCAAGLSTISWSCSRRCRPNAAFPAATPSVWPGSRNVLARLDRAGPRAPGGLPDPHRGVGRAVAARARAAAPLRDGAARRPL